MNFVTNGLTMIIVDYIEFAARYEEIDAWCRETFGYEPRQGMVLSFHDQKDLVIFLLRWS